MEMILKERKKVMPMGITWTLPRLKLVRDLIIPGFSRFTMGRFR